MNCDHSAQAIEGAVRMAVVGKKKWNRRSCILSAEIKNITQIGIVTGDLYAMVDRHRNFMGSAPDPGRKKLKDEARI